MALDLCSHPGFPAAQAADRGTSRLFATLGKLAATLVAWHKRDRQRSELARLDPYTLRDIGVNPGEAYFEAGKPFWRA
ncbi:MAG: DUF1127 domain-containing protein [Alphaproteobacteria bacterium]